MSEWRKITIGDLGKIVTGKTPSTKNENFWNGDIPFVTPSDLQKSKHVFFTERTVSQEGLTGVRGQVLPSGAICVSCIGNLGYTAMTTQTSVSNQQINSIIPGADFDKNFVYYLMKSLWDEFKNLEGQSTTLSILNKTLFSKMEVIVPDLSTQQKIAEVLSSLDDKIELNAQINHNLEEQAKAIFKSWFIDAPESKAWDSVPLKELVVAMRNGDWGKDNPCGNNTEVSYCIRGADIPDVNAGNKGKMPIRYILPKNYEKKHLVEGDIVVEISGGSPTQSTGRCAVISQALLDRYEQKIVCTNFCKALKPLDGYSHFLYYYWTYLYEKGCFFAYENGTTGIKNLDIAGIIENEFLQLPPIEIMEKFNELCDKVASTIFSNGTETERLAQLRDALLPKLMSGEIDVSEVEI